MNWENLTRIAAKSQMRTFGREIVISFDGSDDLKTKGIISTKMEKQKHSHCEVEGYSIYVAVLKELINEPQDVTFIKIDDKRYEIISYKYEIDGFYGFYLRE